MIPVTSTIALDVGEIGETFVRASGPGGQHVNKSSTAVQLRFDAAASPNLPAPVRTRLARLAGTRMTRDGVLVITAQEHRSQAMNRRDALERLVALIRKAAVPPTVRRPTRPTLGSKTRRLDAKGRRSVIKSMRGGRGAED